MGISIHATVLVVAPYTKRIGMAVFRHRDLVYFGVKTFRPCSKFGSIGDQTIGHTLAAIERFKVDVILMASLTDYRKHLHMHGEVITGLTQIARQLSVPVMDASFDDARQHLVQEHRYTKAKAASILLRIYPELGRFGTPQNRGQEEYFAPLLAAVTIGHAHGRWHPRIHLH